ncbi:MAG: TetR/AcrR family transcriptional regulator [Pseudomonadota bacterium]
MPRSKSFTRNDISNALLPLFWAYGFSALSMADIVKLSGISRHALYAEIGGKRDLYLSVFGAYNSDVVSPAFSVVEEQGGLASIRAYFEAQIRLAEETGLPGPGCLVGNAATERAPHDEDVAKAVDAHNQRLQIGFESALSTAESSKLSRSEREHLAQYLVISAQGLWAMSRTVSDAAYLYDFTNTMMDLIERKVQA